MAKMAPLTTLSKNPIKPYTKAPDLYNEEKKLPIHVLEFSLKKTTKKTEENTVSDPQDVSFIADIWKPVIYLVVTDELRDQGQWRHQHDRTSAAHKHSSRIHCIPSIDILNKKPEASAYSHHGAQAEGYLRIFK